MGRNREKIPLFWWSEIKFLFKNKENYGDLLSAYIIEKISGKEVEWVNPRKKWYQKTRLNYLGAGSILHHANKKSVVWGSGIIDFDHSVAPADFRAVRGPRTRKFLLQSGYKCPEIYGDPALLLPTFFHPDIEKEFELAIIPHYNDYIEVCNRYLNDDNILVIDLMTLDIEEVTRNILKCKRSISSSLHGLIVSHAFEIPSVWVKYSDRIFGN
ncbi:MAG: polysaccharide pyruvyl transferase family protein, partial [Flavobacteriaceae bacterium]|nr:polysaccharide pyruvyl transferase family protein [Flavobacteriaceae bacterium]